MRYCKHCGRLVKGVKKPFNGPLCLLGLLTLGAWSIIYILFHLIFKRKRYCSMCGLKTISGKKAVKLGMLKKGGDK